MCAVFMQAMGSGPCHPFYPFTYSKRLFSELHDSRTHASLATCYAITYCLIDYDCYHYYFDKLLGITLLQCSSSNKSTKLYILNLFFTMIKEKQNNCRSWKSEMKTDNVSMSGRIYGATEK